MEVLTEYSSPIVLAKAMEKAAEGESDPYFASMARRAKVVQKRFERGLTDTADALEELFREIELAGRRAKRQHTESTIGHEEAEKKTMKVLAVHANRKSSSHSILDYSLGGRFQRVA